jgi:plasmid stabilization system protein ParE
MAYKLKSASTPTVRPIVVPVAMAVALAHAQHWARAAADGQPEYAYAEQAREQVDQIIRATAVTPDERRFARELANECSMDVETAYRGRPGGVPMRRLAVVVAFALAFQHADDWHRRNA